MRTISAIFFASLFAIPSFSFAQEHSEGTEFVSCSSGSIQLSELSMRQMLELSSCLNDRVLKEAFIINGWEFDTSAITADSIPENYRGFSMAGVSLAAPTEKEEDGDDSCNNEGGGIVILGGPDGGTHFDVGQFDFSAVPNLGAFGSVEIQAFSTRYFQDQKLQFVVAQPDSLAEPGIFFQRSEEDDDPCKPQVVPTTGPDGGTWYRVDPEYWSEVISTSPWVRADTALPLFQELDPQIRSVPESGYYDILRSNTFQPFNADTQLFFTQQLQTIGE